MSLFAFAYKVFFRVLFVVGLTVLHVYLGTANCSVLKNLDGTRKEDAGGFVIYQFYVGELESW